MGVFAQRPEKVYLARNPFKNRAVESRPFRLQLRTMHVGAGAAPILTKRDASLRIDLAQTSCV
jgi:hypothetical protein